MWLRLIFILPIIVSTSSIKVPVDNDETVTEAVTVKEEPKSTPLYYIKDDTNVDSYLVPPDPHNPEVIPEELGAPATYLIPPINEPQQVFYGEPSAQSDWLPILEMPMAKLKSYRFNKLPLGTLPLPQKSPPYSEVTPISIPVPIPATQLVPPAPDAVNEYIAPVVSDNTGPKFEKFDLPIQVPVYNFPVVQHSPKGLPENLPIESLVEPTLALHLIPPKPKKNLKPSTNLYPKKYHNEFKPVPLPLNLYSDDNTQPSPKGKPALFLKPQAINEHEHHLPIDDKKLYNFQKADNIRKLKEEEMDAMKHDAKTLAAVQTHGDRPTSEQETSETNFRYPGQEHHPKPVRQRAPPLPSQDQNAKIVAAAPAPDGRTEFRMHGMKGPHSYQFGFDTGKGKNRQFRYEERDNEGLVQGHYGYVDKSGKLRVVNYSAHPKYGFRADPVEKE